MSETFHSGHIVLNKYYYIKFYGFINEDYILLGFFFMILHEIIHLLYMTLVT